VRLGILTVLDEARRAEFAYLRDALGLTDGNLSRHLRVLEHAGHVAIEKGLPGAPAGEHRGHPDGAHAGNDRAPGAGERHAQPGPHGDHRRRADDRHGPGDLRHDLGRGDQGLGGLSVDKGLKGAFVVQNSDGQSSIPAATATALRGVPGITTVIETRFSQAKVHGVKGSDSVSGVDPATLPSIYKVDWKKGSDATLRELGPGETVVKDKWAKDNDFKVGQTLTVLTPSDRTVRLTVKGTYEDDAQLLTDLTVPNATIVRDFGSKDVAVALAGVAPGQSVDAVKKRAEKALEAKFPSVEVLTKKELSQDVAGQINKLVSFFYVLLGLAVIVSLFGLVNTLALSIYERTRELGMVRAIGMSRRQVRATVRYESVITALIGAALGLVLGVLFAIAMTPALADQGLKISIPIATLIILMLLAAIAGVLAAIGPARRASRLDVLEALAYE